jgi:hypothetical protein
MFFRANCILLMIFQVILTLNFIKNLAYAKNFLDIERHLIDNEFEEIYMINKEMHIFDHDLKICSKNFTHFKLPCSICK